MFRKLALPCIVFGALTGAALSSPLGPYSQTNLVSDLPGVAAHMDANLVNPWGIAFSAGSRFGSPITGRDSPRSTMAREARNP